MDKINIFLIDDHQIVRDGLKALFDKDSGIEVIGESDGNEPVEKLFLKKIPDVLLLDISLGDKSGIDLMKSLLVIYPELKIIILSMYNDEEIIFDAVQSGAKGYLPKNTSKKEIIDAIKDVAEGNQYYNSQIAKIMLNSVINQKKQELLKSNKPCVECLSTREIQILKMVAEGKTNQEVADSLFISIRTVESHKTHIMQKLDLKTSVELVKFAIKNKLTDL